MDIFALISDLQTAFGNPKGDPHNMEVWYDALNNEKEGIASEYIELHKAYLEQDQEGMRDALCDIMIFALAAFHRMGIDANADMAAVVDGVMTRFVKNERDLLATRAKYDTLGVTYTVEGHFPHVILRSDKDQSMPEYPKGKFLKSASYSMAKLPPLPPPEPVPPLPANVPQSIVKRDFVGINQAAANLTAQLAIEREQKLKFEQQWLDYRMRLMEAFTQIIDSLSDEKREGLMNDRLVLKIGPIVPKE